MKEEVGEIDCSVELKGRLREVCDGGKDGGGVKKGREKWGTVCGVEVRECEEKSE